MGLFNKKSIDTKQKNQSKNDFEPIIVDTHNINDELKNIASANRIDVKVLSFKLIKVATSYKTHKGDNYKELDEKSKDIFNDNDFWLNPELKIQQHYKVEVFKKNDKKQDNIIPQIVLSGNKSLTKIVATIKKNLDVKYFSKLEEKVIEDINRKKIHSKILVGIRDENIYKEVKKVVASIRVKNFLEEDSTFVVCQGVDKVSAIDDKFIFNYKNKVKTKDRQGRVDYSRRGFILAVSKGETIMEYLKPQSGIPGRNCQGRFLSVKEPDTNNQTDINITENIIKKEDESKILYVANKNGYVTVENNIYNIQDEMEINSVDFKSTGSIETDLKSNVKINIKEADIFKDAIGPGMNVETTELHVEGNVASGATIRAKDVAIKGQTHKTAIIDADNIKISAHRGKANGKNIEIDRLEGGTVIGDIIKIKDVIGGEIIGKEIYIENLISNASIQAAKLIDIKNVKGSNNKLVVDPSGTKEYSEKVDEINNQIKKLEISMKPIPKILEAKKRVIDNNRPTVEAIKNKILELKKNKKTPPSSLLMKIKAFQKMVSEYNIVLGDFKRKKEDISTLKEELKTFQDQIFSAKIINHGSWKEFNEIKFKLISPPIEIVYNTKENEIIREITLKNIGNEKFEINRSSEYSK